MADDVIIRAEKLGKKYFLHHGDGRQTHIVAYSALRDVISNGVRSAAQSAGRLLRSEQPARSGAVEEFWALKNLDFEVRCGEALGIIGRNGAGKSTLLKVLSRITEPSEGRVTVKGRIASLLEVGTGFHPELTGRENIFLNGAVLGMTRAEVRRKFDEIVDFAGVERFLDTPVKRYSSGMYVRLAFSVAAHLEPEILVIDEVLSVGDAAFQKKCLGKMSQVAMGGRTVLFVSHNMSAIERLCPRAICLSAGGLVAIGETAKVVTEYLNHRQTLSESAAQHKKNIEEGLFFDGLRIDSRRIIRGASLKIEISFTAKAGGIIRDCAVLIISQRGDRVAIIDLREFEILPHRYQPSEFSIIVQTGPLCLVEGSYSLGLALGTTHHGDNHFDLEEFEVIAPVVSIDFAPYPQAVRGYVVLDAAATIVAGRHSEIAQAT